MKRTTVLTMILLLTFGLATSAFAGSGIVRGSTVEFDDQIREVGGISETYFTYDIAYYYDAVADGLLYYTNPLDVIDGDYGEGIDDTYFDIILGVMYGIKVDYTTSDYRPNKIVCADTEHYARLVVVPVPGQGFYDPYQLSKLTPGSYESFYREEIPSVMTETYSSSEYEYLGYTYACIRTPTVATVTFEEINSQITNNPSGDAGNGEVFGGGKRIFANRQSPEDGVNRRTVRVRAKLANSGGSPAFTSGVKIYFRNFDVDDPTNSSAIDENGAAGDDNRDERFVGSPYPVAARGIFSSCTATSNGCYGITDSNGEATAVFQVTRQPGDNFVVAATTDPNYLNGIGVNGIGLTDSSNQQLPTAQAKRSELLTVWIKVFLEVDSMGPVGNNLAAGRITDRGTIGSTPVWLTVSPNSGPLETGRFQGGEMTSGSYRFEVLDNTTDQVQVRYNNGSVTIFRNSIFQLFDDDDFNDDDGPFPCDDTLDGDDGEDVTWRGSTMFEETFSRLQPSSNINENPYAAAYIEPDYTWAQNQPGMNDSNVQFELVELTGPNFNNERRAIDAQRDSAGMENDEFWIGYLLVGYESYFIFGGVTDDPESTVVAGVAPPINYTTAWTNSVIDSRDVTRGSVGALIYIEAMRDWDGTPGRDFKVRTAPHELGHQFGLLGDNSDPTPLPNWGIMSGSNQSLYFVPPHINILRWRPGSPGEL